MYKSLGARAEKYNQGNGTLVHRRFCALDFLTTNSAIKKIKIMK